MLGSSGGVPGRAKLTMVTADARFAKRGNEWLALAALAAHMRTHLLPCPCQAIQQLEHPLASDRKLQRAEMAPPPAAAQSGGQPHSQLLLPC